MQAGMVPPPASSLSHKASPSSLRLRLQDTNPTQENHVKANKGLAGGWDRWLSSTSTGQLTNQVEIPVYNRKWWEQMTQHSAGVSGQSPLPGGEYTGHQKVHSAIETLQWAQAPLFP